MNKINEWLPRDDESREKLVTIVMVHTELIVNDVHNNITVSKTKSAG